MSAGLGAVTWAAPFTFEQEPDTNALRWGTMYTFWFDADVEPATGAVTLGLFKPGAPASIDIDLPVPMPICPADITGPGGAGLPDGNVDALDFLLLISQWGSPGNCPSS
jgi:hypothetical protein